LVDSSIADVEVLLEKLVLRVDTSDAAFDPGDMGVDSMDDDRPRSKLNEWRSEIESSASNGLMDEADSEDMDSRRSGLIRVDVRDTGGVDAIGEAALGVVGSATSCSSSSGSSSSTNVFRCGSTLAPMVGASVNPKPGATAAGGALNIFSNESRVEAGAKMIPESGLSLTGGRGDDGADPNGFGDETSCPKISSSLSRSGICTSGASC
jgi:hypothetical protein